MTQLGSLSNDANYRHLAAWVMPVISEESRQLKIHFMV